MWKDYSADYIKNNRSSGFSVRLSAFVSALLLSLLCGLFYNAWKYEIERIVLEEGGWHSRIMGEFRQEDIENITYFVNVKDVVTADTSTLRQTGSFDNKEGETVIDIYFDDLRAVLPDTPRIAELLGVPAEQIVYNYPLLAMYLIRDSRDTAPRLVFPLFIVITAMASL